MFVEVLVAWTRWTMVKETAQRLLREKEQFICTKTWKGMSGWFSRGRNWDQVEKVKLLGEAEG